MNIEEVLASKSRIRILKALAMKGSLNISEIRRFTGLNYRSVAKSVEALKHMGVIGEADCSRSRVFRVKAENTEASAVKELIEYMTSCETNTHAIKNSATETGSPLFLPVLHDQLTIRYKEPRASISTAD